MSFFDKFRKREYQLNAEETALESFFTDAEHIRKLFGTFVLNETLTKRLLIIQGVGGSGKSTLLKMFRLFCKKRWIPVGIISVDEAKSGADLLSNLSEELAENKVNLREFTKSFQQYQAIQAKVEEKLQESQSKLANVGKTGTKVLLETAAITMLGPIGSAVGGMSAEALTDWLFGFLKKLEVDYYLNPIKLLTQHFLTDIAQIAEKKRVVLMLDTYEQIGTLDEWVREWVRTMHPNILIVIATRSFRGDEWERAWPGWMMQVQFEELKPMPEEHLQTLVTRYYHTIRGEQPDPTQVEAVVNFARGLPLIATTAARLWATYGKTDFQAIKAQVVADLVDRLLEAVPNHIERLIEAAAILRWFDQSVLEAVLEMEISNIDFKELRQFPFTRPIREGKLALHDIVREVIDENLRIHHPSRHQQWHERAAGYFEQIMAQASLAEQERVGLERLYHRIRAHEETGIQLFREMAEELARYELRERLETLLSDVNTYQLHQESSLLWWKYYYAVSLQFIPHLKEAEITYQQIIEKVQDSYLRAKAFLGWAQILRRAERLIQPSGFQKVFSVLEECEQLLPQNTPEWLTCSLLKTAVQAHKPNTFESIETAINKVLVLCQKTENYYGLVTACTNIKAHYALHGRWRKFLEIEREISMIPAINSTVLLKARLINAWQLARVWLGRYSEAEKLLREATDIEIRMGKSDTKEIVHRDLLLAIGMQKRISEASEMFEKEVKRCRSIGEEVVYDLTGVLGFWGIAALHNGNLPFAYDCLCETGEILRAKNDPIRETYFWLGMCCLAKGDWENAEESFSQYFSFPKTELCYFQSGALTGLVRVKHAQSKFDEIPALLDEAEALAQEFEYNDHLAALRLQQGHFAWEEDSTAILGFYQQALIYSLRYNRFLLDDVLFGDNIATPFPPIIPVCLQKGDAGRQMLLKLLEWWQTGINNVGKARPDTISLIPENIPLAEAERLAREIEPGDGSLQKTVVERIKMALASNNS